MSVALLLNDEEGVAGDLLNLTSLATVIRLITPSVQLKGDRIRDREVPAVALDVVPRVRSPKQTRPLLIEIASKMRTSISSSGVVVLMIGQNQGSVTDASHQLAEALQAIGGSRTCFRSLGRHSNDESGTGTFGCSVADRPAIARWARALAPLVDCPRDPRTIGAWSQHVYSSPGAIRNWCHTAGVATRHSLILGRLLRAARLASSGVGKLADYLDISDLRTVSKMARLAGFAGEKDLPRTVNEVLARQRLVDDVEMIAGLEQAMRERLVMLSECANVGP